VVHGAVDGQIGGSRCCRELLCGLEAALGGPFVERLHLLPAARGWGRRTDYLLLFRTLACIGSVD